MKAKWWRRILLRGGGPRRSAGWATRDRGLAVFLASLVRVEDGESVGMIILSPKTLAGGQTGYFGEEKVVIDGRRYQAQAQLVAIAGHGDGESEGEPLLERHAAAGAMAGAQEVGRHEEPGLPGTGDATGRQLTEGAGRRPVTGRLPKRRIPLLVGVIGVALALVAGVSSLAKHLQQSLAPDPWQQVYDIPEVKRLGLRLTVPTSYTVEGEQQPISAEQQRAIIAQAAPLLGAALDALTGQPWYKALPDEEKRLAIDTVRSKVSTNARQSVLQGGEQWTEANAQELVTAMQQKREYDAIPRFRGLSPQQIEAMTRASRAVSRLQQGNKRLPRAAVVALYAKLDPEGAALLRFESRTRNTRELQAFWDAHPLLARYFGNLSEWEMSFIRGEDWREGLPEAEGE